uniref:RRM domain-containing protein n=1 Tax=Otolemur garnettii TaxID=30611 RepID=H0XI90_OTOGA
MDGIVPGIAGGTKWGSNELFSTCVTNGPLASVANRNDNKMVKGDDRSVGIPSRAIYICNPQVTSGEVIILGCPLGKDQAPHAERKNQAFTKMKTKEVAKTMVTYNTSVMPMLCSQPIYIQSNPKELQIDISSNQAQAQTALQVVVELENLALAASATTVDAEAAMARQSPMLKLLPLTLNILHQNFSNWIVLEIPFTQNSSSNCCCRCGPCECPAYQSLDWQNINFSKLTSLGVKYNSKCWDYTGPDPTRDSQPSLDQTVATVFSAAWLSIYNIHGTLDPLFIPSATLEVAATGWIAIPGLAGVGNSVFLVSNFNLDRVTLQSLFILFSVYDNVQRVKILFNKKEYTLVQMANASQAQLDRSHMNGHKLHGKPIGIILSKHQNALPHEGQKDEGLTKDYGNSFLHCLIVKPAKNFQNISPPSATLHLSNMPPSISEEDLKILISRSGEVVKGLKFFQDCIMALILKGSVEEAVHAQHNLDKNHHLQVSFSNSTT